MNLSLLRLSHGSKYLLLGIIAFLLIPFLGFSKSSRLSLFQGLQRVFGFLRIGNESASFGRTGFWKANFRINKQMKLVTIIAASFRLNIESFIQVRALWLFLLFFGVLGLHSYAQQARNAASYPKTGPLEASLVALESEILAFMASQDIPGAIFALSRNGELLAQGGYGWKDRDRTEPMPGDARMRIASLTKPVVAAAVHELVRDGLLSMEDHAFNLGQPGGGILLVNPFPELSDSRLARVTVRHLLDHSAGWDRAIAGDLTYHEVQVSEAMELNGTPGRVNLLNYILGQPLQFSPGQRIAYSNIGYLAAGMIVEQVSGQDLMTFIHQRVMGPLGVRKDEYLQGATFPENQHPLEPFYHAPARVVNVFDPTGPLVEQPYGGWDHEMRIGQGGHISTASALVAFLNKWYVAGPNIGTPIPSNAGSRWRWNHQGSLPGTSAVARQRGDGISYAVVFNKRNSSNYGAQVQSIIDAMLDAGTIDWTLRSMIIPETKNVFDCCQEVEVRLALLSEQVDMVNNPMATSVDRSLMLRLGLEVGQKLEIRIGMRSALYTIVQARNEGGDVLRMGRLARQRLGETATFVGQLARVERVQVERALLALGLREVVDNSNYAAIDGSLMQRLNLSLGDTIVLRPQGREDQSAEYTIVQVLDEGENIIRIGLSGRRRLNESDPFVGYVSTTGGKNEE